MQTSSPSWTKNIQAITWDLDGTLYPSAPELSQAISQKLFETIATELGCTHHQAVERYEHMYNQLHSTTRTLNQLNIDGAQFFVNVWLELDLPKFIAKNPALMEAFANHQSGKKQVIFTNSNSQETVAQKLAAIGLKTEDFDAIHTSIEADAHKPDPKAFLYLAKQLSLQPNQIVYVGDREYVDIAGAQAIGMRAVLVHRNLEEEVETTADAVVVAPEEVFGLFE